MHHIANPDTTYIQFKNVLFHLYHCKNHSHLNFKVIKLTDIYHVNFQPPIFKLFLFSDFGRNIFAKNLYDLLHDTQTYVCVSGNQKCECLGKILRSQYVNDPLSGHSESRDLLKQTPAIFGKQLRSTLFVKEELRSIESTSRIKEEL